MTNGPRTQVVRELARELPPGWRWRPVRVEDGEVEHLLRPYERDLSQSVRSDIVQSGLEILARCIPPDKAEATQETGLVVGYVQSGKTLSFTTLAALACDNGFPLIVVLSGTKTNLYSQTVKRLRRDLRLNRPEIRWVLFEVETSNPDLPRKLGNLLEQWDKPELPGFPRKTALITVLKNRPRLDGLTKALTQLHLNGRPCLIIDDEADQHGLNTKVRQNEASSVYEALLRLRDVVPRHTYVQYTATPQALLLISVLDSLSPQFGWTLSAGEGYCGGRSFFQDRGLARTIPDADMDAIVAQGDDGPPDSLLDALHLFYVGVACQAYHRGCGKPTQQYRSMLVHPSIFQIDHFRFKTWIDATTQSWVEVLERCDDPDRDQLLGDFRRAYDQLVLSVENQQQYTDDHELVPAFGDVVRYLPQGMLTTMTWEINSRILGQWTQNDWNAANSHILVGGENLGRGFTVNGLTITYMPRGRGGGVADTIQQRGRFFGYKRDYLGFCRVFLDGDVRSDYENYIDHESYVMEQISHLSQSGKPMSDWRRRMLLAQSLHPTRRSVVPDIYRRFTVSEWTQQQYPWTPVDDDIPALNWAVIKPFVDSLGFEEDHGRDDRTIQQRHLLAQDIPLRRILHELLIPMKLSWQDAPNFSALELAIQWHLKDTSDATARVYQMGANASVLSGGGKRLRQITPQFRVLQLFQGADPESPRRLRGTRYSGPKGPRGS